MGISYTRENINQQMLIQILLILSIQLYVNDRVETDLMVEGNTVVHQLAEMQQMQYKSIKPACGYNAYLSWAAAKYGSWGKYPFFLKLLLKQKQENHTFD